MSVGMWSNCLGAVRKAGIRCRHQLAVGGGGFLTKQKDAQEEEYEEYSQHSMY